jgi:hypothetical protein
MLEEKETRELETKLAAIAARPDHWSRTKIGRYAGGVVADVERFQQEETWWKRDVRGVRDLSAVNELLANCGLERLRTRDDKDKENVWGGENAHSTNASEVAEHQRDKAKRRRGGAVTDEGEEWEQYIGKPRDDAREWLADLATKIDMQGDNRGFFGTLQDHVKSQPKGARVEDLNQKLVEFCLKQICGGEAQQ